MKTSSQHFNHVAWRSSLLPPCSKLLSPNRVLEFQDFSSYKGGFLAWESCGTESSSCRQLCFHSWATGVMCKRLLNLVCELHVISPRQLLGQHLRENTGCRQHMWLFLVCDQPSPLRMGLCHSQNPADWTDSGWLLCTVTWARFLPAWEGKELPQMCCVQAILPTDTLPHGARVS